VYGSGQPLTVMDWNEAFASGACRGTEQVARHGKGIRVAATTLEIVLAGSLFLFNLRMFSSAVSFAH
jgi:hypothetical protein